MTFSGDQNGGLARYLPGCTAGWREEAQKWAVMIIQRRHPRCLCIKMRGRQKLGLGLEGGLGFPTRHQTHCSNHC